MTTALTPPAAGIDPVAVHRVVDQRRATPLTANEQHRAAYLLIAHGDSTRSIAELLGVSERTVGRWRARKLGQPPAPVEADTWKVSAACAGTDARHFFPDDFGAAVVSYQRARAVCAGCPVRSLCLDAAMGREGDDSPEDRSGMWGGLSPEQRAALARVRQPRPAVLKALVRPAGAWGEADQARHRAELLAGLRESA